MKTNEQLKAAVRQASEEEVQNLLKGIQDVPEGDLKEVEKQVVEMVFGLGRKLMQCILSSQQSSERPPARRLGSCGHVQRLVGQRSKQVLTLVGKVEFRRPYYQCLPEAGSAEEPKPRRVKGQRACTHGEAPADALWGVQDQRTTAGVQQAVSCLCASLPLKEAAATLSRLVPLQMSARQALTLMQPVGQAIAREEDERVKRLWKQAGQARTTMATEPKNQSKSKGKQKVIQRLYIELDGVLARLRRGSVPMEAKELKRSGDVYREVKVGAVFPASRGPHRTSLAKSTFVDEAGPKHYVARRCKAEDFGKLLYALAVQDGLRRAQQVVVLGDGAPWIWRLVAEHFPGAVQIVDLWHARQHVWQVAHAVYGRNTPAGAAWAQQACSQLVQGQIEDLVQAISHLPAIPPEPDETRSVPEKAIDYFTTNAARMRYPTFRAQGMQVGSGIAEAACKTVVSTRAKRSGMRWTPAGLDAVLALRTSVLNGSYDSFWKHRSRLIA